MADGRVSDYSPRERQEYELRPMARLAEPAAGIGEASGGDASQFAGGLAPSHRCVELRFGDEPVADAADGLQELGRRGAVLDVPPQPDDEVVDGAGGDAFVQPPHFLQDLPA